jgi:hypothetical protein
MTFVTRKTEAKTIAFTCITLFICSFLLVANRSCEHQLLMTRLSGWNMFVLATFNGYWQNFKGRARMMKMCKGSCRILCCFAFNAEVSLRPFDGITVLHLVTLDQELSTRGQGNACGTRPFFSLSKTDILF